jgi:membrane fusion protein (multidrug efflux system)
MVAYLALAPLLAGTAACSREVRSDPGEEPATERRLSLEDAGAEEATANGYTAFLYSEHDADVYTRMPDDEISGSGVPIATIQVEIGDRVRSGALLATLQDDVARLEVQAYTPEVEESRLQLERVRELHETGVVSDAEYESTLYANKRAEAALKQAELYLARTRVRAPFSGVVSRRYVREGDLVDETQPLFRITAMAPLRARLLVPEENVGEFSVGGPVRVSDAAGREAAAKAIIVGPTVDPGSGTREVIVELDQVGEFRPGASVVVDAVPAEAEAQESP